MNRYEFYLTLLQWIDLDTYVRIESLVKSKIDILRFFFYSHPKGRRCERDLVVKRDLV